MRREFSNAMAHWTDKYIGRPYSSDYDCAHLLVDVNRETFHRNVDIPVERTDHIFKLSAQIDENKTHFLEPVEESEAKDGDAILMICLGRLNHIGILAIINGVKYVLHNVKSTGNVTLHRLKDLERYNLQIEGFYRVKEQDELRLNTG